MTERAPGYAPREAGGGESIQRSTKARVVLIEHTRFPGFCRVIWNDRVTERTGLSDNDRH